MSAPGPVPDAPSRSHPACQVHLNLRSPRYRPGFPPFRDSKATARRRAYVNVVSKSHLFGPRRDRTRRAGTRSKARHKGRQSLREPGWPIHERHRVSSGRTRRGTPSNRSPAQRAAALAIGAGGPQCVRRNPADSIGIWPGRVRPGPQVGGVSGHIAGRCCCASAWRSRRRAESTTVVPLGLVVPGKLTPSEKVSRRAGSHRRRERAACRRRRRAPPAP
jgi:hypothetical protein